MWFGVGTTWFLPDPRKCPGPSAAVAVDWRKWESAMLVVPHGTVLDAAHPHVPRKDGSSLLGAQWVTNEPCHTTAKSKRFGRSTKPVSPLKMKLALRDGRATVNYFQCLKLIPVALFGRFGHGVSFFGGHF